MRWALFVWANGKQEYLGVTNRLPPSWDVPVFEDTVLSLASVDPQAPPMDRGVVVRFVRDLDGAAVYREAKVPPSAVERCCGVCGKLPDHRPRPQGCICSERFVVPMPGHLEKDAVQPKVTGELAALAVALGVAPPAALPSPPCAACDALGRKCWRHRG